jgi:hypothetical protein
MGGVVESICSRLSSIDGSSFSSADLAHFPLHAIISSDV